MECPEGMERPPNSPHVATWPDWLHDPTEVVAETVVSNTAEFVRDARFVPDGNMIEIRLLGAAARPPVEEVVNPMKYMTPAAPGCWLLRLTVGCVICPPVATV